MPCYLSFTIYAHVSCNAYELAASSLYNLWMYEKKIQFAISMKIVNDQKDAE